MRNPREVLASKFGARVKESKGARRPSSVLSRTRWGSDVPLPSFCKRCVPVALSSVVLRSVAYEYPKNALRGAFQNTRRAARTAMLLRMSERLATLQQGAADMSKSVPAARVRSPASQSYKVVSRKSSWRSVHSVVSEVLRNARNPDAALPPQTAPGSASKQECVSIQTISRNQQGSERVGRHMEH